MQNLLSSIGSHGSQHVITLYQTQYVVNNRRTVIIKLVFPSNVSSHCILSIIAYILLLEHWKCQSVMYVNLEWLMPFIRSFILIVWESVLKCAVYVCGVSGFKKYYDVQRWLFLSRPIIHDKFKYLYNFYGSEIWIVSHVHNSSTYILYRS